tara:strand:+ start:1247 stop:3784 length:2538 start_codon:yes stop_codon:yes gene_type:complete
MDLKAFKGLPHEFGGIDYTEGSEVEGGEFAVKIGKSGNEYIFDKNSSEGEKLSKEYKRLDTNGRLSEDDPLSLETFDQIAREEALKHAQRSVNEKGIDPFRNMYDQGGQAANGGVKYATGGVRHSSYGNATNEPTGSQSGSMGQYVNAPLQPEDRMRTTSFGNQNMRLESDNVAYRGATTGEAVGWTIMDTLFSPMTTAFTGKSPSEMGMADAGIRSDDITRNALGDQSSVGSGFGIGFAESEGVISDMGTQFFNMMGDDGGAMPKDKYSGGGAFEMSGGMSGGGGGGGFDFSSMMGGMSGGGMSGGGGTPWMKIFEAIHNFRQGIKKVAGPGVDNKIAREMGDEYVRQPLTAGNTTTNSGIGDFFSGMAPDKKGGNTTQGDAEAMKAIINAMGNEKEIDYSALGSVYNMQNPDENLLAGSFGGYGSEYNSQGFSGSNQLGGDSLLTPVDFGGSSAFGGFKNGGAKKGVYGYYANGGGKKKEEEVSKDYANKIRKAEKDLNESLGRPMTKSTIDYFEQLNNNPRLAGDDIYLDPYRHGMAGYYTADAMRKKMPDWMPESVANKLAIAGSTIAGVGHEFTSPATERMGLVDGLTEAGEDAYNNYVGAKMIEDVLFDREAKQLMLDNIRKEKTYAGVVQSDSEPYTEFDPKRFKNGGGKDKEELLTGPTGPTGATGIAVSPTGAAYSSDQMSLDNRGVGSSDYGVIPANLEQYARTFFGSNKQFTEKDMTPEEYKAAVDLYNIREKSHTIGYPDHDKVGSTNTSKAGMLSKLTNEPDIIRNLIGAAATKDGYITSDYNFGNKPFLEILKNLNAEDLMAWAHNNSPFVDSEAMAKKDAIKIKMPKNRK